MMSFNNKNNIKSTKLPVSFAGFMYFGSTVLMSEFFASYSLLLKASG